MKLRRRAWILNALLAILLRTFSGDTPMRLLALGALALVGSVQAATLPSILRLDDFITSGVASPIALRHAGDGSGRIFITERAGSIRIWKNGALLATPFLTIPGVQAGGERGLLGLAFHPDFETNRRFFVHYSAANGNHTIAQYTASIANPDLADPPQVSHSAQIIFSSPDLASNHNGGDLHFGADGFLYASFGDGGPQNDPNEVAQNLGKRSINSIDYFLLGKIVRLDINNVTASGENDLCGAAIDGSARYAIPSSNPFANDTVVAGVGVNTCDEIWSFGFRNPYRFSFDRQTGDMWVGDVGQDSREETDFEPAGAGGRNYGWRCLEGTRINTTNSIHLSPGCAAILGGSPPANLVGPVLEWDHSLGVCSVIGGYVYRGPAQKLKGLYFSTDYCQGGGSGNSNTLFGFLERTRPNTFVETRLNGLNGTPNIVTSAVVGFGEDEAGHLYVVQQSGLIRRLFSNDIFGDSFGTSN